MSFGCSEEHWNVALPMHETPCDDLPGKVSRCDMNLQKLANVAYMTVLTPVQERHFMWIIIKRQARWTQLKGRTWEDVIGSEVALEAAGTAFERYVPECTRRISSIGGTAFTILYALEHLNTSNAWTEKAVLTIDILIGSSLNLSKESEYLYEAILHRAPKIEKLIFYFFLPGKGVPGQVSRAWES